MQIELGHHISSPRAILEHSGVGTAFASSPQTVNFYQGAPKPVETYTPPEGMDRREILLWLCEACSEFPCELVINGEQTILYNEQEFDAFIDAFGRGLL